MKERINCPGINTIVKHTGWGFEDDKNYPCDVLITGGQFMSNGRVSNFWYWRRILPDGVLSEVEHGYGSFEKSNKNYKIETRVSLISAQTQKP
jgi:hypothetical protein